MTGSVAAGEKGVQGEGGKQQESWVSGLRIWGFRGAIQCRGDHGRVGYRESAEFGALHAIELQGRCQGRSRTHACGSRLGWKVDAEAMQRGDSEDFRLRSQSRAAEGLRGKWGRPTSLSLGPRGLESFAGTEVSQSLLLWKAEGRFPIAAAPTEAAVAPTDPKPHLEGEMVAWPWDSPNPPPYPATPLFWESSLLG